MKEKVELVKTYVVACYEKWSGEKCSRMRVYRIVKNGKTMLCRCGGELPAATAPHWWNGKALKLYELPWCVDVAPELFEPYFC